MAHSRNIFSIYCTVIGFLVFDNVVLTVASEKCSLYDPACAKQTVRSFYESFVDGVPEKVTSSDPLMIEQITADLPGLKYTLNNCKISGLKKCVVEEVIINKYEMNYDYKLKCPHLVFESDYEISGKLGDLPIEGKDKLVHERDDVLFLIHGNIDLYNTSDGKLHIHNSRPKAEISEPVGKVSYNFQNLFKSDPGKAAAIYKYIRENSKDVDKIIRPPMMEAVINSLMNNVNEFHQMTSIQDVFTL